MGLKGIGNIILVIGKTEGHLDQSIFSRNILNEKNGPPPEINLFNEKNNGETLLKLIKKEFVKSAHDVSLGGIITSISKMCISGKKGIKLNKPKYLIKQFEYLFGEDQGRYLIEIEKKNFVKIKEIMEKNSVHYDELGIVIEKDIIIDEKSKVTIDELTRSNSNWLPKYMSK